MPSKRNTSWSTHLTAAARLWRGWEPSAALAHFVESDPPPLALSFSSLPLADPAAVLAVHARAAALIGRRLLVQRGWAGFSPNELPADVAPEGLLFVDAVPHDWLFARAGAAILHGGIGSIARALRAGCPLVIEPYGNDQFFNARQVVALGLGAAMHPFRVTPAGLARVLVEKVLTLECRARVEALGAAIRSENGLNVACDLIEGWLRGDSEPGARGEGTIRAMRKALYILGQLDDADLEWLIGVGQRRTLETDEVLIQQGCPADALSIVLDGSLVVDLSGKEITRLGAGEIVGEMSFVDADPPSATVRAARSSLVLCVPRMALAEHLEQDTAFAARFYRAIAMLLSGRMREWNARLGLSGSDDATDLSFGAEIDAGVLDTVHLAGARFDHILQRLAGR